MTILELQTKISQQLDAIAAAPARETTCLQQTWKSCTFQAQLRSVDRLACEVERITVELPRGIVAGLPPLEDLAAALAAQLTYLEENLVVLEADALAPEVQLRSQHPQQAPDAVRTYFEVRVGPREISLQRYAKSAAKPRTPVASVLTRATFCRLSADLVNAAMDLATRQ